MARRGRRAAWRGLTPGSDAFTARYGGVCAHCDERYKPGEAIVGRGKGRGALHAACAPVAGLVVRQMTDEERARVGRKP